MNNSGSVTCSSLVSSVFLRTQDGWARRWDGVTGLFSFFFQVSWEEPSWGGRCYDPLCPAHPACSPYTGHMEGAGCGPTTIMMSSDYPHLVPGYKSTATSDGGPFSASATLTHTFDKRAYSRTYPLHASTHRWKPLDFLLWIKLCSK